MNTSAPPLRWTPSVQDALSQFASLPAVSSWDLVTALLSRHSEYADHRSRIVLDAAAPSGVREMATADWLTVIAQLLQPDVELHGRLLIVALCHLDPTLRARLDELGFLQPLIGELREPLPSLFRESGGGSAAQAQAPQTPRLMADRAPLHIDSPATHDALGRAAFARALAGRLNRVWQEYAPAPGRTSFMMHLHGPWGSGKTSLMRMLRAELQTPGETVATPWMVVDFNAWQHQRLDPPWWPLLTAVYRQSREQLARSGSRRHAWRLKLRESLWRVFTLHRDLLILLAVAITVIAAGLIVVPRLLPNLQANAVAAIIGLGSAVLGFITVFGRTLLSGSATAAQGFLSNASDPLERIAQHFRAMVTAIDRPVLVLIDDLDRCQPAYAVRLLEGIQTLFGTSRVMYVVAADRIWLHTSFEKAYAELTAVVREPGRPLGALFLEKAFELSLSMPPVTEPAQRRYWQRLLEGQTPANGHGARAVLEADRKQFEAATSEADIARLLSATADPEVRQQRLQLAVERMAHASFEREDEVFLQRFATLLEPNPRAMKRVLNAYAIQRDLAVLRELDVLGDEALRTRLALWTILSLRWPLLGDYLAATARGRGADPSEEVAMLLRDRHVRAVIEGRDYGATLDLASIAAFEGWTA